MALQVVREHLQQQCFELMSWQGNPEVDPSIWFIGNSGRPEWVDVRAALLPDDEPKRAGYWDNIARGCSHPSTIGHFAPAGICGVHQLFDLDDSVKQRYRGHRLPAEFQGLEQGLALVGPTFRNMEIVRRTFFGPDGLYLLPSAR